MNCVQQHVNLQMWNFVYCVYSCLFSLFRLGGGRRFIDWVWFHFILKCTYGRTLKITNMLHIFLCKYLYFSDILLMEILLTVVHFFSYKFSDWAEFSIIYWFLLQQLQWFYFRCHIINFLCAPFVPFSKLFWFCFLIKLHLNKRSEEDLQTVCSKEAS